MKNSDLGFHAYIRGIILFGFALLILGLIITGNIKYYIAPKMMPFVYFSLAVFFILGVIQIIRSTTKGQSEEELDCDCGLDHQVSGPKWVKAFIYSIFILPLLMGFMIPDKALNSTVAENRGIIYGSGNNLVNSGNRINSDKTNTPRTEQFLNDPDGYLANLEKENSADEPIADNFNADWFGEYYEELLAEVIDEPIIVVTEENYLDIMTLLDLYLEKFIGKDLQITGFVFREPDFAKNQLVVARFSMTCCTADAGVYGTLIRTSEAHLYYNDTWLKVRGTIDKTVYNDVQLPIIELREVTVIDEPESPYVYPSEQK